MIPIKRIKPSTICVLVVFTITIMLSVLVTSLVKAHKNAQNLPPDPQIQNDEHAGSGDTAEPGEGRVRIVLDNTSAGRLVADRLSGNAPVKDVSISFYEPNGMNVDGAVTTDELSDYLPADLSSAVKMAISLLPDECDFAADTSVFSDGSGGVTVEILAVSIGSLSISPDLLPEGFSREISRALTEGIKDQGLYIERISITNGALEAEGKLIEDNA